MRPPVVIVESYDISIHPSVEHVEAFLEPVDVRDGIYVAYDCEGHFLDLTVESVERQRHFLCFKWMERYEHVVLSEHVPTLDRSAELRGKLVNCLISEGASEKELQDVPLEELIKKVERLWPWHVGRSRT